MELASKYNPAEVEAKWYQYWLDHKLFSSKPYGRQPYTIVIPPPNVTGVLHMGHMLNNTIQDILVRRARMEGKNACWVPGTDHASIATEAKVVNRLAEQGIKKSDLTREEFLKHAWAWTEEHGGIILKQLRKLGASCDWDRTAFTMDEERSKSVIKVFVDLYNKGLIYRGVRMVNWDPKALTALSDEEVIYKEEHSKLYYLRYYVADDDLSGETGAEGEVVHRDAEGRRYAVVATTRPETIMGDTAMCINPNDVKNRWLSGKKVVVPLVNRVIPVIEDEYVDIEFGTGCLKVTPAHDVNDYMLGEKYNLPSIDIFNDNGTISNESNLYVGMDRFAVREQIEKDLTAQNLMEKVDLDEDTPIEAKMLTRAIENSQTTVESRNFQARKSVLEYDDVMNKQREIIYGQRKQVLDGMDVKDTIMNMMNTAITNQVNSIFLDQPHIDAAQCKELLRSLEGVYFPKYAVKISEEELPSLTAEELTERFIAAATDFYEKKEQEFTAPVMREVERVVLLRVVDEYWMEHIDAMQELRQGIRLRAYAQTDPVIAYKKESLEMFEEMISAIQEETVRRLYSVRIQRNEEIKRERVASGITENVGGDGTVKKQPKKVVKIGRNDLCPCGSGLKWKKCDCKQYHS